MRNFNASKFKAEARVARDTRWLKKVLHPYPVVCFPVGPFFS